MTYLFNKLSGLKHPFWKKKSYDINYQHRSKNYFELKHDLEQTVINYIFNIKIKY